MNLIVTKRNEHVRRSCTLGHILLNRDHVVINISSCEIILRYSNYSIKQDTEEGGDGCYINLPIAKTFENGNIRDAVEKYIYMKD